MDDARVEMRKASCWAWRRGMSVGSDIRRLRQHGARLIKHAANSRLVIESSLIWPKL